MPHGAPTDIFCAGSINMQSHGQNTQTLLRLGIGNLFSMALHVGRSWQFGGACEAGLKVLARAPGHLFRGGAADYVPPEACCVDSC
jgi:hypothetical protein